MYYTEKEYYWMPVFMMTIFLVSMVASLILVVGDKSFILEWEIMSIMSVTYVFNFFFDWMSTLFFSCVALISSSVLFYSGSYMEGDKKFSLFMNLVMMFVVSMFFMVFSLNLVSMMLGWDGLGVISYILVIYYNNEKSSSAGMITALSNRVGDSALLIVMAVYLEMGSWNYMFMNLLNSYLVSVFICLAAITKSAQIPFSAWLPAAMAAPTPVSALVHSSTLVTAGVYLLIRFSELLKGTIVLSSLVYLGMLTTLMASTTALFEIDFKKVVALSTLSQLGIMVTTLSFGFVNLAFVHLLTHAMFKALLFMCSGKVIHCVAGYQDVRKMGGLIFNLPITGTLMNLSSFALCGVPFLSGFYSKDIIFESILMIDNFFINYLMFMMIVGFSASYSFRLSYFSIINFSNQGSISVSSDKDWVMLSSKLGLTMMTMISGAFLIWLIMPVPSSVSLDFWFKMLTIISMFVGFFFGLILSLTNLKNLMLLSNLMSLVSIMEMWNLPVLSGSIMSLLSKALSSEFKNAELGWYEVFSGQGVNFMFLKGGEILMIWLKNSMKGCLVIFITSLLLLYL